MREKHRFSHSLSKRKRLTVKMMKPHEKRKFLKVMREYYDSDLYDSHGYFVSDEFHALAIAFSEARRARARKLSPYKGLRRKKRK